MFMLKGRKKKVSKACDKVKLNLRFITQRPCRPLIYFIVDPSDEALSYNWVLISKGTKSSLVSLD